MWSSVLAGFVVFGHGRLESLYSSFIAKPSENVNEKLEDIKTNFTVKHDEWSALKVKKNKLDEKLKQLEWDTSKLEKLLEIELEQSWLYQEAITTISTNISDIDGEIAGINKDITNSKYTLSNKQNDHALLLHNIYQVDSNIQMKKEDVKKYLDIKNAHEKLVDSAHTVQESAAKDKETKRDAVTNQKGKINQAKKDYEQKQEQEGKARQDWIDSLASFATAQNKYIEQQRLEMEYEQIVTNKAAEIKDFKNQKDEQEDLKVSQMSITREVKETSERALTNCNVIVKTFDSSATCSLSTHRDERIKKVLDKYQLIKKWEVETHQILKDTKELIQKLDTQIQDAETEKATFSKALNNAKTTARQLLRAKDLAESDKAIKNSIYTNTKEDVKSSFSKYQAEVAALIPLNEALADSVDQLRLATSNVVYFGATTAKINQDLVEAEKTLKEAQEIKTERDSQMVAAIEDISALETEIFNKYKNLREKQDEKTSLQKALNVAFASKATSNDRVENIKNSMHSTEIKTNKLLREINEIKTNINTLTNEMIS